MEHIGVFLFVASTLVALSGCAGNATIDQLNSDQRAKLNRLEVYDGKSVAAVLETLGQVQGIACQRNAYAGPADNGPALSALKIHAASLNANAVENVECFSSDSIDWGRNCWSTVTCLGDAVVIAEAGNTPIGDSNTASQGSCFFVSGDGILVTNNHVVEGRAGFKVMDSTGSELSAVVLKSDPANDLAVLKVASSNINYLPIAPFGSLKAGQKIFTVGYPASSVLGTAAKFTDGVVSSTTGLNNMANMFQMSVPIQPGSSGGAVVNERGQVVGVVTSTLAVEAFLRNTGSLPQNVNWAVKSEYVALLAGIQGNESGWPDRQRAIEAAIKASCMIRTE